MKKHLILIFLINIFIISNSFHLFLPDVIFPLYDRCEFYQIPLSGVLTYEISSLYQSFFDVLITDEITECGRLSYYRDLSTINTTYAYLTNKEYKIKNNKAYLVINTYNLLLQMAVVIRIDVIDVKKLQACDYYKIPNEGILNYEASSINNTFFDVLITQDNSDCYKLKYFEPFSIINTTYASVTNKEFSFTNNQTYLVIRAHNYLDKITTVLKIDVETTKMEKTINTFKSIYNFVTIPYILGSIISFLVISIVILIVIKFKIFQKFFKKTDIINDIDNIKKDNNIKIDNNIEIEGVEVYKD